MIESLEDLEKEIIAKEGRLYLFYEKPEKMVAELIKEQHVDAVVVNRDYTPYSKSIQELLLRLYSSC